MKEGVASDGLGPHDDHPVRTGEYVYWGYDLKPALPPAMPACFTTKFGTVCTAKFAGAGRVRGRRVVPE